MCALQRGNGSNQIQLLFVFPKKKRGLFTFLFYLLLGVQADIFKSSSFLLSAGVSYGVAVRKDRSQNRLALFLSVSKGLWALI